MKNLLPLLLLILLITSCEKEMDESKLDLDLVERDAMIELVHNKEFISNSSAQNSYESPHNPHGPIAPSGDPTWTSEGDAIRACLSQCDRMYRAIEKLCEKDPNCNTEEVINNKMKCRRACYN